MSLAGTCGVESQPCFFFFFASAVALGKSGRLNVSVLICKKGQEIPLISRDCYIH